MSEVSERNLEFARRLTVARMRKHWNQSELARQAALHSNDRIFGRALVSNYERGRMFPNPFHLKALATALGISPNDLVPSAPNFDDIAPQIETKDLGGGMMLLRVNQSVPWPIGIKILELLRGAE
jgi:transcriptional regulator with XRE-family HTH domain